MKTPPTTRREPVHPVARACLWMAGAYFCFWACAPVYTVAPPVPMPAGARHEVSGSYVASTSVAFDSGFTIPITELGCYWSYSDYIGGTCIPAAAHVAYSYQIDEHQEIGAVGFAGFMSLVGLGAHYRFHKMTSERVYVAAELNGGWLWADVSMMASARLGNHAWLYTRPNLGYRGYGTYGIPVGLAYTLDKGGYQWVFSSELGVTALPNGYIGSHSGSGDGYSDVLLHPYLGLGVSYRY